MKEIKNVLICGIGAIGSIYANKINCYDKKSLKVLVDKSRYIKYTSSPKTFNGHILEPDYILPDDKSFKADLIIIATKYDGLKDAVYNIENFVKEDTIIISLLNGITSEKILAEKYGWRHILLSYYIGHSAVRNGNNITHDGIGTIVFGVKDKNINEKADIELVKNYFDKVGIEYKIPKDMYRSLWLKYMLNTSCNQLSSILGMTFGQMQNNAKCRRSLANIMNEVVNIARPEGVSDTQNMIEEAFAGFDTMNPDGKTSMLQDVEAKRKTEVEMFAGTVIDLGKKHGISTPYNQIIKEMIEIIQENY